MAFLTELAVLRGDPGEVPPEWEQLIVQAPPMPLIRITISVVHALFGDLDRARAEFEQFRHLPDSFPVGIRWFPTLRQIGLCAVMLDDLEVAEAVYRKFVPFARYYSGDGSGGVFHHGSNAGMLGDLALIARRWDDAVEHYRAAVDMNVRIGARPFVASARLGWAQTLAAQGTHLREAAHLVEQAAAEFHRLDMPGRLRTAAALRAELSRRRPASLLSAREQEVAELVAEGRSNREIGTRLFISERTVETHVGNILAKLGFASRTEIVAWMLTSRTPGPR
jgi:DNA-binding CsgD family transcriptional regulator